MATGYSVNVFEEVSSTQETARQLLVEGERPTLVVAGRQTAGRGRSGSKWENAPRAVATSLAFQSIWPAARMGLVPLLAGVAACRVLGPGCRLKWPNDVLVEGLKAGGILVEVADSRVVVGMGLNLFWPDAPAGVGAVEGGDPGPGFGVAIAREWADTLLAMLEPGPDAWPRAEYEQMCATLGENVIWEPGGEGMATAIGADGSLRVEVAGGGVCHLTSGEVRHVRALR